MTIWPLLALAMIGIALSYFAVWLTQLKTRNAGVIDAVWAFSLAGVAVFYGVFAQGDILSRMLVAIGGGVWGWRLGSHLWRRNVGQPEDARYRQLREEWGAHADARMLGFFGIQAIAALMLSLAFVVPATRETSLANWQLVLAAGIWLVAVGGEAMADRQLRVFVSQPQSRGQVCRVGLWRYSRHPNYFFECLHWVAYVPLAVGTSGLWLTFLPPLFMAWLLIKVSGIPMLEAHLAKSRPGYADYQRNTSMLLPWPPRDA